MHILKDCNDSESNTHTKNKWWIVCMNNPHTKKVWDKWRYLNLPASVSTEGLELHGRVHALSGVHEVAVQMRLHDGVQELELCVVASPQNPLQQVASLWEKKIKTFTALWTY